MAFTSTVLGGGGLGAKSSLGGSSSKRRGGLRLDDDDLLGQDEEEEEDMFGADEIGTPPKWEDIGPPPKPSKIGEKKPGTEDDPIGQSFTGTADQYFSLPEEERTQIPNLTITGEAEDEPGYNPREYLRGLEIDKTRKDAELSQQEQRRAIEDRRMARTELGQIRAALKQQRDLLPKGLQLSVLERDMERLAAQRNEYLTAGSLGSGGLDPWDREKAQKLDMALGVLDQVHQIESRMAEIPDAERQINREIQDILAGGSAGLDPDTAEQALRAEHALEDEQLAEREQAKQATITNRRMARASSKYKAAAKELEDFEESQEILAVSADAYQAALDKGRSAEEAALAADTAKAKAIEAKAIELGLPELETQLDALGAQYDQLAGLDEGTAGEDLGEPDPAESKLLESLREMFPGESDEALREALKE